MHERSKGVQMNGLRMRGWLNRNTVDRSRMCGRSKRDESGRSRMNDWSKRDDSIESSKVRGRFKRMLLLTRVRVTCLLGFADLDPYLWAISYGH